MVEEAETAIDRFVNFYNNERLNTAIGYISPIMGPNKYP